MSLPGIHFALSWEEGSYPDNHVILAGNLLYTEEAFDIIKECESLGLVHNIDNCAEGIRVLCNCCPCCCSVLKSLQRGEGFAGTPSRYVIRYDPEKCIGCGLCVTTCPTGSNAMVLRSEKKKIPASHKQLTGKIGREALFYLIKKKMFGKTSRP